MHKNLYKNNFAKLLSPGISLIVIFFFNTGTAVAASRPYLPNATKQWPSNPPLATAVATIQAKQQDANQVDWVPYGSPYFSNPAGNDKAANQITKISIEPRVFAGFQDIDEPSNFEKFANFPSKPATKKIITNMYSQGPENINHHVTQSQTITIPEDETVKTVTVSHNGSTAKIDDPIQLNTATAPQLHPWTDLDL